MTGGQDTWARWKSVILGLSQATSRVYLRESEGFDAAEIERFLAGDRSVIEPADWHETPESKAAFARFNAWEAARSGGAETRHLQQQETRAAALPTEKE